MSDHDDLDDALRQRMQAGIRGGGDARDELSSMRPRFERARRRRATVTAAASTAAVAIVVVGALSLGGGPRDERVQVADSSVAPRSTTTTSTTTTVGPTSAAPTSPPTSADPGPSITTPTPTPTADGGTNPGTSPVPATSTPPANPLPTVTSAVPAPTTATPGGQRVLSSDGGTATVTWTATSLVVDRTDPAAGWTVEQVERKEPTRVVVKFRRDDGGPGSSSVTIDARVVAGRLEVN